MKKLDSMRSLVLNASYEPLSTIETRRAFCLVLDGRARTVLESDVPMRSKHLSLFAPSVVQLEEYVNVPNRASIPVTRRAVLARDRKRCAYGVEGVCMGVGTTIDHVIPKGQGGQHRWENVVASCFPCNQLKGNRRPEEAGMPLLFQPRRPLGPNAAILIYGVEPEWEEFILAVG